MGRQARLRQRGRRFCCLSSLRSVRNHPIRLVSPGARGRRRVWQRGRPGRRRGKGGRVTCIVTDAADCHLFCQGTHVSGVARGTTCLRVGLLPFRLVVHVVVNAERSGGGLALAPARDGGRGASGGRRGGRTREARVQRAGGRDGLQPAALVRGPNGRAEAARGRQRGGHRVHGEKPMPSDLVQRGPAVEARRHKQEVRDSRDAHGMPQRLTCTVSIAWSVHHNESKQPFPADPVCCATF